MPLKISLRRILARMEQQNESTQNASFAVGPALQTTLFCQMIKRKERADQGKGHFRKLRADLQKSRVSK